MNVLWVTIPVSLLLAGFFVIAFIVAVRRDQFEDLVTPAHRMLLEDAEPSTLTGPLNGKEKPHVGESKS